LPTLTQIYPSGLQLFQSTNRISFVAASAAGINTNSIVVSINGTVVSNLVITGSANSWNVSYQGLLPNSSYTVVINVTDLNGNNVATTIRFDTFAANNYTWEGEDYDYGDGSTFGGLFVEDPQTNAYYSLPGTPDIDYHELYFNGNHLYRTADQSGTDVNGDTPRPRNIGTNDYNLGWFAGGEWVNYTRRFPSGTWHVYGRFSRGETGNAVPILSKVTGGWGTTTQTTVDLGSFTVPNQGWGTYNWVPLRDGTGALLPLTFDGSTNTLRITSAGPEANMEVNVNFLMLVPPLKLSATRVGGNISVSFGTQSGFSYQVEYKNTVTDPNWTALGAPVAGDGLTKTVLDPIAGQRIYRLRVQ
jgi:hypothetical protein